MTPKEIVSGQFTLCQSLYEGAVKDLSEQDMRFQPFEGANHINWILVHLAVSEDSLIAAITGKPKRYSESLHKSFGGGSTCSPDDGMTKSEAWRMYAEQGTTTVEFIRTFPESRYDEAAPESLRSFFPTIGAVVGLMGTHPYWHVGQATSNRRALKKPMLFTP